MKIRVWEYAAKLLLGIAAVAVAVPAGADSFAMTTEIAPGGETPDTLQTSIGTLKLRSGVPTPETSEKL